MTIKHTNSKTPRAHTEVVLPGLGEEENDVDGVRMSYDTTIGGKTSPS